MTNRQRIAIARIISDMIKADNIIEEREIIDMNSLMEKYDIQSKHMSESRGLRFSEAVNELMELGGQERTELFDDIRSLSLSDKACVQKEAMLLLALKFCLVERDAYTVRLSPTSRVKPRLIACPTSESALSDPYIVYVESRYDQERNREIAEHFRLMCTSARLYGVNFIYIPELVKEFMSMREGYVTSVIRYMAPNLDDQEIERIYTRLSQMTTESFFHDVLYDRLNVRMEPDVAPSLLINIGTSVVPYCVSDGPVQYYTEFLCLPLYADTLTVVDNVLQSYCSYVSLQYTPVTNQTAGHFRYFGFYKALFDFLIAPPPVLPDLVFLGPNILTSRYEVLFRYSTNYEKILQLTPQAYDTYYQCACGGIATDSFAHLKTVINRLRGKVDQTIADVTCREKYKPERVVGRYKLTLDRSKIFKRRYLDPHHHSYKDLPVKI